MSLTSKKRTLLLYGRSSSGKSTSIGELAEHLYTKLGLKTRLYTADRGGFDAIQPYIDLGIIQAVEMGSTDPFMFLSKSVRGFVRDGSGKWVPGTEKMGLYAFEGLRSFAESLMSTMIQKAAANISIGGGANVSFTVQSDGESVKVSGSNMAMFGIAQARISDEVWESFKLDAPYILWTSSVSKDEDQTSSGKVLGPDVIGKALTAEVPRWFNFSFRIDVIPAQMGKPERHILYLGNHVDVNAGNVPALGNIRRPLDAPAIEGVVEPASLVKALSLIEGGYDAALGKIRQRMGIDLG